jgi:hypothetical protein
MSEYTKTYSVGHSSLPFPIVFVSKQDAIDWANKNLFGEYQLTKDEMLGEGWTKTLRAKVS